ncbi:GNAT family N-acetyltransferase [Streptomyces sp. NPDC059524]|uniref:GNAT family N-acetyltransferase n=1 Tax=Streptomyces sp. NPDC059524 TaxID=3346856 RepID=UPI0036B3C14B
MNTDTLVLGSGDLTLRPWEPADAAVLPALMDDDALRRWTTHRVTDTAGARRWIAEQNASRGMGERFCFAVVADGEVAGHAVVKRPGGTGPVAEVGYWIGAPARGRGLAGRAVALLTDWVFTTPALTRVQLIHNEGNPASCRVAEKAGFALTEILPPLPGKPGEGHLHVRERVEPQGTSAHASTSSSSSGRNSAAT